MTQKDKKLLLKDLCARVPYKVKGIVTHYDEDTNEPVDVVGEMKAITRHQEVEFFYSNGTFNRFPIEDFKPYLRPMLSMTDEELIEFLEIKGKNLHSEELRTLRETEIAIVSTLSSYSRHIDWLNAHHFEYRGLIEKGLAIDACYEMIVKLHEQKLL